MADNTCKKARSKKDRGAAEIRTKRNKARRAATADRRASARADKRARWARRNGVKSPAGNGKAVRKQVRMERELRRFGVAA